MLRTRTLTLTLGPVLITGLFFSLGHRPGFGLQTQGVQSVPSETDGTAPPNSARRDGTNPSLVADCQRVREMLMKQLGAGFVSAVHTPYVLIGDGSTHELERHYRTTIEPTQRALAVSYFDAPAAQPVAILLLSGDEAYQECAERLDGQRRAAFAGYYERGHRRIVVNLATGDGTIAHELTHALAHFDFPGMPEWFDEGLASLHEEGRFSDDGLRIVGLPNWRSRYLKPALEQGRLRSLGAMLNEKRVRPEQQQIDYAQARYFCLFLQHRRLLEPFYRKFRQSYDADPTGRSALATLCGKDDLASIDQQFREWLLSLQESALQPSRTDGTTARKRAEPDFAVRH